MIEKKGKSIASKMSNSLSKKSFGGFFVFLFSILIFIPSFSFANPIPDFWPTGMPNCGTYYGGNSAQLISLYQSAHGSLPDYYLVPTCSDVNHAGVSQVKPDPYTTISAGSLDISAFYGINVYRNGVSYGDLNLYYDNRIEPSVREGETIRISAVPYDNNSVLVTPPNNPHSAYQPRWQSSYNINDLTCNQVD